MRDIRYILLSAALLAIAAIAYLSFNEARSKSRPPRDGQSRNQAPGDDGSRGGKAFAELSEVKYRKTVKDFTEFEIVAKNVEYFKDDNSSKFEGINMRLFTEDGEVYRLSGDSGIYDSKKGEVSISGDVVLTSKSGYELRTASLLYANGSKVVSTGDMVKVIKENLTFNGRGMTFDLKKERLNIMQEVSAHIADFGE